MCKCCSQVSWDSEVGNFPAASSSLTRHFWVLSYDVRERSTEEFMNHKFIERIKVIVTNIYWEWEARHYMVARRQ